jgi:hypothetical protein
MIWYIMKYRYEYNLIYEIKKWNKNKKLVYYKISKKKWYVLLNYYYIKMKFPWFRDIWVRDRIVPNFVLSYKFFFFCNFHKFEILKFPLRRSFYTNYTLKFERGSTITNYFRFSLAGISTIILYSFEFLWTSYYPSINIYVRGMTSTRPHWTSKYLDYRFWKYGTSFIIMLHRERLLWSRQAGEGLFLGFVFSTWNWYDFWKRNYSG